MSVISHIDLNDPAPNHVGESPADREVVGLLPTPRKETVNVAVEHIQRGVVVAENVDLGLLTRPDFLYILLQMVGECIWHTPSSMMKSNTDSVQNEVGIIVTEV